MKRYLLLIPLAAMIALGGPATRGEPTVSARVHPPRGIVTDRSFRFVIQVTDAGRGQVRPPALPDLNNLIVLGGPNTSTSFTWTNGRSTSAYEITWLLLAQRPGVVEIPPLAIVIDSRSYQTNPVRFDVGKAIAAQPQKPDAPPQPAGVQQDAIVLRAELGVEEVWVGQAVPLTVTLLTTQRVSDTRWREQPEFGSFWVENLEVRPEEEAYRTRLNGTVYTAYPIERKLLVPTGAGEFELDPYVVQLQVRRSGRDFFDIFGRSETLVRSTEPLRIRVKALPDGAPEGFTGAVGSFTLKTDLDSTETNVDDAVALRVSVQGEGSLRSVPPPPFKQSPELTVFDPKVTSTTNASDGTLRSRKIWEWIIVPLAAGEVRLPEISFDYFDPAKGSYATVRTSPMTLAVKRGRDATDRPVARSGIKPQQQDLLFIKTLRGQLSESRPRAHQRGLFTFLLFTPLALVPLVVVLSRRKARLQQDLGLARSRRAGSRARKRLAAAAKHLDRVDAASFHEEVARALVEYVADRFNRSATGLTYDLADELLGRRDVDSELRRRYRACLETCDFARFVPASGKSERRSEVLAEALELLTLLERAW